MSFYFERNKDRCLEYNLKGNLEGCQTYEYKTGEFLAIRYKDGVAYGPLECWDKDSKLLLSVEYKKGKLQKNPPPPPAKRPRQKLPVYEGYIDEVVRGCKKFGYRIMGDSGKAPWDVERVGAMFEVPEKVTLQQARALVTKLKKGMSDEVNAHEKIRPYLREYPFSPQRTDIDIEFTKADGEVDRVSHCSWYDEIRYWKGKTCICVETYEEAVRALR